MVELTVAARRCLDEYLALVRSSLRHCRSVNVTDVERDVVEHIQQALAGAAAAVEAPELENVLRGLGSPSQWVPQEELSGLERVLLALKSGPEDLRLGYMAFGLLAGTLFASACLNLMFGFGGLLPFLLLGIAASFILARASLSAGCGVSGAEKWLIYPSLVVVYVPLSLLLLLWPLVVAIVAEMVLKEPGFPEWARHAHWGTIAVFTLATVGCPWWGFLAFVAWRWPEVMRDCYAPFAATFGRHRSLLILSVACFTVFLCCMAVIVEAVRGNIPFF
jgi:hypothetical protein